MRMIWIALAIGTVAVGWFLRSWRRWHLKQRGDANELEALDEMIRDYAAGKYDNVDYIRRTIADIERTHEPSPSRDRELRRAREALENKPSGVAAKRS